MKRREFLGTVPAVMLTAGKDGFETEIVRLKLRHTWTTVMSSSDYRDTLHVRLTRDGMTGRGRALRLSVITNRRNRRARRWNRFGDF